MQVLRNVTSVLFCLGLCAAPLSSAFAKDDSKTTSTTSTTTSISSEKLETEKPENQEDGDKGTTGSTTTTTASTKTNTGTTSSSAPPGTASSNLLLGTNSSTAQDLAKSLTLDSDQTKSVIGQGKAATMQLLLTFLQKNFPGEVVDVKLHDDGTNYIYELRYLSNIVTLRTVYLDALTVEQM